MTRLVTVRNVRAEIGGIPLVKQADFWVDAGEVVTIVGSSGAGKTTLASLVIGEPAPGVSFEGEIDVQAAATGQPIGYLPQDAGSTLNPSRRIGAALADLVRIHRPERCRPGKRGSVKAILEVLAEAAYPVEGDPELFLRRYPWQFSGGQRQRLALAQVLTMRPGLLVLDEPTTGLDSLARARVIDQIAAQRDRGLGVLLITHDRFLARTISDRIHRMSEGVLDAQLDLGELMPDELPPSPLVNHGDDAPLRMRSVSVRLGGRLVLNQIDLDIRRTEMLAIMGPSGAGKTTIARCIAGFVKPKSGSLTFEGQALPMIHRRSRAQKAALQYVWQETASSFDPYRSVLAQCASGGINLRGMKSRVAEEYALELLAGVELSKVQAARLPSGLSGGQLRRAALVRALISSPQVLVCDEVTSGLDPEIAELVLDFIDSWRKENHACVVLITHTLHSVAGRADRLAVVEDGRMTWLGSMAEAMKSENPGVMVLRKADDPEDGSELW